MDKNKNQVYTHTHKQIKSFLVTSNNFSDF